MYMYFTFILTCVSGCTIADKFRGSVLMIGGPVKKIHHLSLIVGEPVVHVFDQVRLKQLHIHRLHNLDISTRGIILIRQ